MYNFKEIYKLLTNRQGKTVLIIAISSICLALIPTAARSDEAGDKALAYKKVREHVSIADPAKQVLTPEGEFITVFNDKPVTGWITKKIDMKLLNEISARLSGELRIELNSQGFPPAATRETEGKADNTNYDAIWVRDSVWVYYSLLSDPSRKDDARKLLLALWDYYSTDAETARFSDIIVHPERSLDQMAMPHIRFDGSSQPLGDVIVNGKPEVWNHRQIDAHGIFFTALGEAVRSGLVTKDDLTQKRHRVLSLYPLFLKKINFSSYEDAGAWEELPRKNSSSIALATRSIQVWKKVFYSDRTPLAREFTKKFFDLMQEADKEAKTTWSSKELQSLEKSGLATVRRQLLLGGESPDYPPGDIRFRLADAALLVLIIPSTLEGLSEAEQRKTLLIVESLKRKAGILRYSNDSYQGGNYWIAVPSANEKDKPTLTGDTSSKDAFLWRLSKLIPDTEAQWFFDSIMTLARLRMAESTKDSALKRLDIHLATIHLKRALGQLTGDRMITADGKSVKPLRSPESINTVVIDGKSYYLPSPITPLNWSKATLGMAIREYGRIALGNKGN